MCRHLEPERDIVSQNKNDFCSDDLLEQILEELRESNGVGVIECTHLRPAEQGKDEKTDGNLAVDAAHIAGSAATVGVCVPALFTGAGFTANGIAAGSVAAFWQSMIGNVAAGSVFATLQSLGAVGSFAMFGPVAIIAAAATGASVVAYKTVQKISRDKEKEKMQQRQIETSREVQSKIANGTAEKDIEVCQKCWIKMKLSTNQSYF